MANLFFRSGKEFTGEPQLVKGKPVTIVTDKCSRCGGAGGAEQWRFTGWTCYRCGGKGLEAPKAVKLYSQEQLDKLNAAQATKLAKKQAEIAAKQAAIEAERNSRRAQFLADNKEILALAESLNDGFINDILKTILERASISDRQVEVIRNKAAEQARKATQSYVGQIGERREFQCKMIKLMRFENNFGYRRSSTYLHLMQDQQTGNTIKYFGSSLLCSVTWEGEDGDYPVIDKDEVITFKATISEHEDYKGEKQTVVQRPKEIQ